MTRRLLLVVTTLALCALLAFPALAVPPDRFDIPYVTYGPFPFNGLTCDGDPILSEVTQGGAATRYYDQSGATVKAILDMDAETVWFLPSNPAHRLVATGHWTFFGVPGVIGGKQVGPIIHLAIPGVGKVFLDAGQVVFDADGVVKIAGTHPVYDPAQMDLATLCAALE